MVSANGIELLEQIRRSVYPEHGLEMDLAISLARLPLNDLPELFAVTNKLRELVSWNRVYLCSIVNAKSGLCPEDCRFCAQSSHYRTGIRRYPLLSAEEIVQAAAAARANGAREFGIVTSGKGVNDPAEVAVIEEAIARVSELGLQPCVSPGIVSAEVLSRWQRAGLRHYHHNLEAAPSFFGRICTTHSIEEDIAAIRTAKSVGLPVCAGGIFGMGESWAQRVELAFLLKDLQVDYTPLNFFNPIPGTPLAESAPGISPREALKTIALFRLVLPRARIVICGGRAVNLRELQSMIFMAGANALMIGNYLTTPGRPVEEDMRLLADLGLEPVPP